MSVGPLVAAATFVAVEEPALLEGPWAAESLLKLADHTRPATTATNAPSTVTMATRCDSGLLRVAEGAARLASAPIRCTGVSAGAVLRVAAAPDEGGSGRFASWEATVSVGGELFVGRRIVGLS